MLDWIIGMVSFLLFFLYDWNRIFWKKTWMRSFFAIGNVLLAVIGMRMICRALRIVSAFGVFWLVLSACFLTLLIYTLFFALPFESTYCRDADNHPVCRTGLYGLCRHPGIWWFFGLFAGLGMAAGGGEQLWLGLTLSAMNLFYAWYQDRWIFEEEFSDYEDYRREVPFLLPKLLKRR
ncbi:MAG: hypothetical protein ACI39W_06955 [Brotaphodocola sp.]